MLDLRGPFDPDYDLWAEPPRNHTDPPRRKVTYRPRLPELCCWCMERVVVPMRFDLMLSPSMTPPGFAHLCEGCRNDVRMFVARGSMHRAMTPLQFMRKLLELMDLENHLLPE